MKRFLTCLLLSALTVLVGANALGQNTKPQPSARDLSRRVSLRCSPNRLWLGDTLTLNMSVPHGRDLAILAPGDKFFWLRSWEPNDAATTANWYAFEKLRQLKIVTTEAMGRVSTADEPIFTKTGWYRIRVSYNLETDDGTRVNQCRVYYTHRRRSGR